MTASQRVSRKFLVNPAAGGVRVQRLRRRISQVFGPVDMALSAGREDLAHATRAALLGGAEVVVAVGGDGTVNAVVQGFFDGMTPLRPDAMLALANLGTGSDYYRSLGGQRDWRDRVSAPVPRKVDVGVIVSTAASESEKFVNMASFGLSALAVAGKNRSPRWWPAPLRYLLPVVLVALRCHASPVRLTLDGQVIETTLLSLLVAKGRYGGGGMRVGIGELDDGLFTVTLIGRLSTWIIFRHLHHLYLGTLDLVPGVTQLRGRRMILEAQDPWPVEIDGEVRPATCKVEITLLPKSLVVAT